MTNGISLLLVEDDMLDVRNVQRAFAEVRISNPLHVVSNGEEALAFLRNQGQYADRNKFPRPGLILLDINMPIMSGLEFLQAYKAIPELRAIPSIVLTTSAEESDRIKSYNIGIAGYIVKPVSFVNFVDAIKRFDLYWEICKLPVHAGRNND